jgi:hypothetical protein
MLKTKLELFDIENYREEIKAVENLILFWKSFRKEKFWVTLQRYQKGF